MCSARIHPRTLPFLLNTTLELFGEKLGVQNLLRDSTSLFSTESDVALSNSHLTNDLSRINGWPQNWKISFNRLQYLGYPWSCIQLKNNARYSSLIFNNVPVKRVQSQKHPGLTLDSKPDFHQRISWILSKLIKLTAVLRKLRILLTRTLPISLYKAPLWEII